MLKILMIGPSRTAKGGIATVINSFSKSTQFEVHSLTTWTESSWQKHFVKNLLRLRYILQKEKYHIIHFHVAQRGSFWRKSILLQMVPKKVPTVFHMHASQFDQFYSQANFLKKYWIKRTFDRCGEIVAVSSEWQSFYQRLTHTEVSYVKNSVSIQKESCFSADTKRIVTLGKLGTRKGTYDIIKAAKIIWLRDKKIVFELYGNGELEICQKLAETLPNVTVYPWISHQEISEKLKGTSLHLLPSYHEGLPMAVLETMALGIPNLTSTVGGLPSLIDNGSNGWLLPAGDPEQLAQRILEIFEKDCLTEISIAAKKTIESQFSLERYFEYWNEIYRKLLEKKSKK